MENGGKFESVQKRAGNLKLVACVFGVTLNWGMRVKFQI